MKKLLIKDPIELSVILLLILGSLIVFNAFVLDSFNIYLSINYIILMLIIEIISIFSFIKIELSFNAELSIYCVVIFILVVLYSLYITAYDFMPISGSVDAVHHYVLISYIYNHGSLPRLDSIYYMGEMVQYPFGASFITAFLSKFFGTEPIIMMQILTAIVAGLIVVLIYLISIEVSIEVVDKDFKRKSIMCLISPFMVLSIPIYFLGQFTSAYYYSMMFGELLVIGTLLTMVKIENGNSDWIYIFYILSIGIIFTYTIYIIITFLSIILWSCLNKNIMKNIMVRQFKLFTFLLLGLFAVYSYSRFVIGKGILQGEGTTVIPDITNFNQLFLILTISGILLLLYNDGVKSGIKKIVFIYMFVGFIEMISFLFLNKYELIAKYHAYKVMYLQVPILSIFTCIPIIRLNKFMDGFNKKNDSIINKKNILILTSYGSLLIIVIISLYFFLPYATNAHKPVITMSDVKMSKYVDQYSLEKNLKKENITIITHNQIRNYWISNGFLYMNKEYAIRNYLNNKKIDTFSDWLNNNSSLYLITDQNLFVKNASLNIEYREGNVVFLRKITG